MTYGAKAQSVSVPFDLSRWDTTGAKVTTENYQGKESFVLKSGVIYFKDADFLDGTIEADVSMVQQRQFPGIVFRMQDRQNYEEFYLRAHQSGNPDANQYTPVFNGNAGWQLYYGDKYSYPFNYMFNQWHHIKIVVHGLSAEIYIDDMEKPLINVPELKRDWKAGKIGFSGGAVEAGVHFANLKYTPATGPKPVPATVPVNGSGGLVTQYQVSNGVNGKLFNDKYTITPDIKKALSWNSYPTEASGVINISKYTKLNENSNTVVAKVTIESATEQLKLVQFGFSEYVIVYLNDKALFAGNDKYGSRDYRFLGTIGFFDAVILSLKKGTNELWFVVSENFGGWGVQAKFENMNGITLK